MFTLFPIAEGDFVTVGHYNELKAAVEERKLGTLAAISEGDFIKAEHINNIQKLIAAKFTTSIVFDFINKVFFTRETFFAAYGIGDAGKWTRDPNGPVYNIEPDGSVGVDENDFIYAVHWNEAYLALKNMNDFAQSFGGSNSAFLANGDHELDNYPINAADCATVKNAAESEFDADLIGTGVSEFKINEKTLETDFSEKSNLKTNISEDDFSFIVENASTHPGLQMRIGSEDILLSSASPLGGDEWGCSVDTRGANGTTAQEHSAGAEVLELNGVDWNPLGEWASDIEGSKLISSISVPDFPVNDLYLLNKVQTRTPLAGAETLNSLNWKSGLNSGTMSVAAADTYTAITTAVWNAGGSIDMTFDANTIAWPNCPADTTEGPTNETKYSDLVDIADILLVYQGNFSYV